MEGAGVKRPQQFVVIIKQGIFCEETHFKIYYSLPCIKAPVYSFNQYIRVIISNIMNLRFNLPVIATIQ